MKKTYVSPLSVEVSVASEQLLATSESKLQMFSTKEVNTEDEGAQLGGNRRGEWGNLW